MNRVYRGWVFSRKGIQEDNQVIYTATRYTTKGIHRVLEGTYQSLVREIDEMGVKDDRKVLGI